MSGWLGATPAVALAAVLLWAAGFKLLSASAPGTARRSALRVLVGTERVVPVYRAVGVVEALVAAALLVPVARPLGAVAAVLLSAGMVGYLGYARVAAPESSCGCLSEKVAPVGARQFARAGLMLAAGVGAFLPGGFAPAAAVAVLLALALLSPELDSYWLTPLRRLRVRLSHPLAGTGSFEVPLDSTVAQLLRSDAYRSVAGMVRSDLLDSWDDGEWRILTYTARRLDGSGATAVFAVPLLRYEPDDVRVVLVDGAEDAADSEETAGGVPSAIA